MTQSVLKCRPETIKQMNDYYRNQLQNKKPQGAVFFAKTPECAITAYKKGKVLFQGKAAEAEAGKWDGMNTVTQPKKQKPATGTYAPPENISELSMIGSDEVGTGDYFGPITVAAVLVESDKLSEFKRIGLKDSKLLKDWQIYDLAEQIKPHLTYELVVLDNPTYNHLQAQGMTQGKMKALLHNKALLSVTSQAGNIAYDGILIDQFAEPDLYFRYLQDQADIIRDRVFFSTKAESLHAAVAAASIIARQAFLDKMGELEEFTDIPLPKGAGPAVDKAAAHLISKSGEKALQQVAKVHFANTHKAKQIHS